MTRLLIAIPSKGRADTIAKETMRYVPQLGYDYRVFVEPQDHAAYSRVIDPACLYLLPENDRGLCFSKFHIQRFAQEQGYDAVFKHDDDIYYWTPGTGKTQECIQTTAKTLKNGIAWSLNKLNEPNVVAVGYEYRTFMHIATRPEYEMERRLQTCYVVKSGYLYSDLSIPIFEDFYTTMMIWLHGGSTVRYLRCGMFPKGNGKSYLGQAGGLTSFNRIILAEQAISHMRSIYPALKLRRVSKLWGWEPDMAAMRRDLKGDPRHARQPSTS